MRAYSYYGPLLSGLTAAALLAGCSAGGLQTPAANAGVSPLSQSGRAARSDELLQRTSLEVLAPGIDQALIGSRHRAPFVNVAQVNAPHGNQTIIADAASATVTVWNGAGQLVAILFDGIGADPTGLATDAAQNLYVVNVHYNNVIVYPKPYTSINLTLEDPNEYPLDVAVSQAGVVAVANYTTVALTPGSVSFYAKGSTSACATVSDTNWVNFVSDAFDASGNLFVVGLDKLGTPIVGKISGGCKAASVATLKVGNGLASPGGVQVYKGKILVDDPQKQVIYTYAAPSGGSLGVPKATTALAGANNPIWFAMLQGGQNLWTADFNSTGFSGKYTYPGGAFVKQINDHLLPAGVAVNPAALP
jgi:hypothetical protein